MHAEQVSDERVGHLAGELQQRCAARLGTVDADAFESEAETRSLIGWPGEPPGNSHRDSGTAAATQPRRSAIRTRRSPASGSATVIAVSPMRTASDPSTTVMSSTVSRAILPTGCAKQDDQDARDAIAHGDARVV
jgi:hypothetical protein